MQSNLGNSRPVGDHVRFIFERQAQPRQPGLRSWAALHRALQQQHHSQNAAMVSQQLEKALERATLDGFENDYFLEESRERELAYSKACFYRWRDTLETALRFLGGGEGKSVLDVGVSQLTLCLPDFFKTVYGLDLTSAFEPRCSRKGIKLFHGGVHLDDTVTMIPPVD